ncbi:FAM183A [Cervus elaphus hippelaphus]|uniref:FAM183A n=1 Tax=Cervus elaphus hippelaphus TaxID=46360 RepID=A0A212CI18_CEREH|nr:FAM183A [Cervus elaphus hippelaphus]
MAGHQKEKAITDEVHQNQILRELYLKELRTQKLYTQYHVNPLRKVHTIARKPMSWHDNLEEPADDQVYKPYKPIISIGDVARKLGEMWNNLSDREKQPYINKAAELKEKYEKDVNPQRDDRRLNHFRVYNDITLYKAKMWSLGEDDRHK